MIDHIDKISGAHPRVQGKNVLCLDGDQVPGQEASHGSYEAGVLNSMLKLGRLFLGLTLFVPHLRIFPSFLKASIQAS
jgi:hypothetical protein